MILVDGVSVTYPSGTHGLRRTTIRFSPGEFTVLLGLSGAGKSTLLRTLNHLVVPSEGRIEIDGLGSLSRRTTLREHRRRTAMIFQQHQLIGRYTALQNTLIGRLGRHPSWRTILPLSRAERAYALYCLERVGLLDKALERANALSGGQQQRVGIARALAQEPRLILADEPVASLDPATAHHVLSLLHEISKQDDIPVIVSLHQLDQATAFADRIVGLRDSQVVFDGPPSALGRTDLNSIYAAADIVQPRSAENAVTGIPSKMEAFG